MSTLKASDVGFMELTYGFVAECDDCSWKIDYREATVKDCRDHVRYHKHSVIRTRHTVSKYYVMSPER